MRMARVVLGVVFSDPFNVAVGLVTGVGALAVLAWSGQVVVRLPVGGLYWDLDPARIAAILAISAGFAVLVPTELEVYRSSRRRSLARTGGSIVTSSATGIAALSCCSPVLLPAALALMGVSGTSALYFNLALRRWFVALAMLSLLVLVGAFALAARDLNRACKLPDRSGLVTRA